MAPVTPAMANVDHRKQLLQKLASQAQSHVASSHAMSSEEQRRQMLLQMLGARAAGGGGAANGTARQGARTQTVHGSSIANFMKSKLGVGGRFADGLSNFSPAPQLPAPPPPAAGNDPAPAPHLGQDVTTAPGGSSTPIDAPAIGGAVDPGAGTYAPTAQDNAIKGQTTTFWGDEANLGNAMNAGLVPIGNGIFFDPSTGSIVGSNGQPMPGAPNTGHGATL